MKIEMAGSFTIYKRQQPAGSERIQLCSNIMRVKTSEQVHVTAFSQDVSTGNTGYLIWFAISCFFSFPSNRLAGLLAVQSSKPVSVRFTIIWIGQARPEIC